jgi:uncharacterized glyoxalase superfamily protein PhnB
MSQRPPVSPYLTVTPAAAAIAYYCAAFGAVQKAIMPALDGMRIMHCELSLNGGPCPMITLPFPSASNLRSQATWTTP